MDAPTITAIGIALAAIIVALTPVVIVLLKINTALEVINNMKPGEQLDAMTTARLREKPHDDRTPTEQAHLDSLPPEEAAQGPSPTVAERTEAIYEAVNGKPTDQPSLYVMVQTLEIKVDGLAGRFDRLEARMGIPDDSPPA